VLGVVRQHDFTFAAVAAAQAFFAEMVVARILGAAHTDAHRFLSADATWKRHEFLIFSFLL
jgi:hypothetical protein